MIFIFLLTILNILQHHQRAFKINLNPIKIVYISELTNTHTNRKEKQNWQKKHWNQENSGNYSKVFAKLN